MYALALWDAINAKPVMYELMTYQKIIGIYIYKNQMKFKKLKNGFIKMDIVLVLQNLWIIAKVLRFVLKVQLLLYALNA